MPCSRSCAQACAVSYKKNVRPRLSSPISSPTALPAQSGTRGLPARTIVARASSPVLSAAHALPVFVVSDRRLLRELMVENLWRRGFSRAKGRKHVSSVLRALDPHSPALVFVDAGSEKLDPEAALARLAKERPRVATIAIGAALQLAAKARDAHCWIAMSQSAQRITALATKAARLPWGSVSSRDCPEAEQWSATWTKLTGRQRQVLALLGSGMDNHRLSLALGVSERAVKAHVSALLERFDARSRTELVLIAARAMLRPARAELPFNL